MARPSLVMTSCSRNAWSTWVTPSMMTCCIWVSIAWRIARRSSPFSFAWENCILILLKTPCDECVCYDSFIQGNSSARFFVPSSTLRDRYATEILQKTGVCLAFLLRNFEVQFLVLLKQVGKYSTEHGNESNNDFDHEQTSFC